MPVATQCFAPFQAQAIRATRIDACGVPVIGSKSTVVSDGVISVELKGSTDSGTDVEVKNAKGDIKISAPGKPVFKYYDVTLTMTDVDPDLFEMSTGMQLVIDAKGNPVGFRVSETVAVNGGIALETWTAIGTEDGVCVDGVETYGYFLLPQIINGQLGDITLNDGAMSCVLTGRTRRGSGWGVGPYDVVDTAATGDDIVPGPLIVAIGVKDHLHMQETTVAPPESACGAVALAA